MGDDRRLLSVVPHRSSVYNRAMTKLTIRLLGTYAVQLGEQPLTNFRAAKNQALFAYLASEADRPHTRPRLAGLLWPEQPEAQALLNLRQALFRLRNLLENEQATPPFLQISQTNVQFDRQSDHWFDAAAFAQLLASCDQHARAAPDPVGHRRDCGACAQRLAQAVELYRGDFMQGIYVDDSPALEEWLLLRREWFHHQALGALYDLAAWHEAQGDYDRADHYARRQLGLDPLHEEAHRQLMRALALGGKRTEAIAQYEACSQLLYTELGVPPAPETTALVQAIEEGTLTPAARQSLLAVPAERDTQLPTVGTTFVGRETEGEQLRAALLDPAVPLVTLVGPGGVGKSRLALAAATNLLGAFANGVYFVALAGVDDREGLVTALAGVLGLTFQASAEPEQQLLAYLRQRETLLILDNFEHLLAAVDLIERLLAQSPRLKLLVTSRERLNLQRERLFVLTGLTLPPLDGEMAALGRFSSVQLFLARAQQAAPGFTPTAVDLPPIATICRLVDGLPLGIELAAAWTEHYSCAEIGAALAENLDFLQSTQLDRPQRHRSLRAVFTYSWQLLAPSEQLALAQMSIFRGVFSRAAAQTVTQVALPQLLALVNKSLVRVVAPGRYLLHELVRQFAAAAQTSTATRPQFEEVQRCHARYYLQLVAEQEGLFGQQPQKVVDQLLQELENIRQAWRWGVDQALVLELTAAVANLARLFDLAGFYREAATTWQLALRAWPVTASPFALPVNALVSQLALEAARTQNVLGDYAQAISYATQALDLCAAGAALPATTALLAMVYQQLGFAHYRRGDHAAALPLLQKAVTVAETSQQGRVIADCLLSLGEVQMYQGDAAGRAGFARALALYRQSEDRRGEGAALYSLGLFAQMQSDFAQAQAFYEEALRIHRALGDRHHEAITLNGLAGLYAKANNFADADRCLQQTLQLAHAIGYQIGEVNALNSLGVNQMHQGKNAAAQRYYEQALVIARQSGYRRGEGALLNNLGNLASDGGDYGGAEEHYRAALAVAHATGDRYHVCARLHNLGNMRRFQGDYVGAHNYYQESATIAEAIGDRWIEGDARADLALSCAFLCDQAAAWYHANRALTLANAIGDQWCECKALAMLGWFAVTAGDKNGLLTIERAITLAQAAREVGMEGVAHARHGIALLALAQPAAALTAFEQSITLRRASGDRVQLVTAQAGLALAHLALAQLPAARNTVETILQQIGEKVVGVADDPLRVYAACYAVLHTIGDHRATLIQQRALLHMRGQAEQLSDPAQQERFVVQYQQALGGLENVADVAQGK